MKLTPLDIKKQEFKKTLRGYDPVEVDTFMNMMATEFEDLLRTQKEMRDRIVELEVQLKDYRQIEKTFQQTLLQAQETSDRTYETARKEAELIVRDAEQKATELLAQAKSELQRTANEVTQLVSRKDSVIGRLRVLLSSELDLIKTLEMGGAADLTSTPSLGTGKESVDVERVLRNLNDERTPEAH
jgi:cell division initiation protein